MTEEKEKITKELEIINTALDASIVNAQIISGELMPLISGDSHTTLIPLEAQNQILLLPSEALNIIKCLELRKEKPCYLIYKLKLDSIDGKNIENLGALVKIHSIKLEKPNENGYSFAWVELSTEKTVKIIEAITFESQKYVKIEEIKYFTNFKEAELKKLVEETLEVARKLYIKKRKNLGSLPAINIEVLNYRDYAINLSIYFTDTLYSLQNYKSKSIYILLEPKIEQRILYIQTELLNLIKEVPEIAEAISTSIQQVTSLQSGYIPTIFYNRTEEIISLFTRKLILAFLHKDTPEIDILMKLFYEGQKDIILLDGNIETYSPNDNLLPAIHANIDNVNLQSDNSFFIYVTPKKRIKLTEIILYQGLLYSKGEEIQPLLPTDSNKAKLLKELVEAVIKLYQEKKDKYIPFFNSPLLSFEIYAENLSFYVAEKIFSYPSKEKIKEFSQKDLYTRFEDLKAILNPKPTDIHSCTTAQECVELANSLPNGETEKGLSFFNKALEFEPSNQDILYSKALVLNYLLKRYEEAIDTYNKISTNIYEYKYLNDKGNAYIALKQYKEAINCYNKVPLSAKSYISARYFLGSTYFELKNYKNAIKYFDEAIKLCEEAKLFAPEGFSDPLLYIIFHTVPEEKEIKAFEIFNKILKANPNSKSALILKIRLLSDLNDYEEALIYCNKLFELKPICYTAIYIKALMLLGLKKVEETLKYLNEAILINDSYEICNILKALCLSNIGKYEEAIKECDTILAKNSQCKEALIYKALAMAKMGNSDEGFKFIESALTIDSNYAQAWFYKGHIYCSLGNYREAIKAFDEAIKLSPNPSKELTDLTVTREETYNKLCEIPLVNSDDIAYLIENTPLSPQAKAYATINLNFVQTLTSESEKSDHVKYLKNLLRLPWGKYDDVNIDLNRVEKVLEKEHYGLKEVKNRILDSLVFMARSPHAKPLILCLVGPPGVGKTSIATSIANALKRKCVTISLAGAYDSTLIRGCMSVYRGATSSKILSSISEVGTCNPVMILDELDKIDLSRSGNLEGALLQLIDPSQNNNFTDEYFDFSFDLSKVFFIITANELNKISEPLLNRMEVIELTSYTESEKLKISQNYILPKILEEANLSANEFKISEEIIKHLINNYTNEPGVREIERLLRKLVQKYLREKLKGKRPVLNLKLVEKYFSTGNYRIAKVGFKT
ncbi:tetratricopeptide repeat protein [Rickettsia endosymbiont of Ceutorhynchus obstrictus]|uniref:tetratricopeptide repeat protein n=1 Tax=Rickettsia endosymbiont of Ceutorhynchus obstrictus TaxID=3066249 RepID=UPI003132A6AE